MSKFWKEITMSNTALLHCSKIFSAIFNAQGVGLEKHSKRKWNAVKNKELKKQEKMEYLLSDTQALAW